MADKELQLIVDGFDQGEHFTVLGRCGDAPIHVGDVFDKVYRYKRQRYPDELGDEPVRGVEKPAAIRVVCIHAYQRSLKTLGEGMTGSLTLEGDGLQYNTSRPAGSWAGRAGPRRAGSRRSSPPSLRSELKYG